MKPHQTSNEPFASEGAVVQARAVLNNGVQMPWLGLGVYQINGDAETAAVVRAAIEQGYRSVDTAALYGNERGVGQGIRSSGVPRAELFVTSKVWNDDMRRGRVADAFEQSLSRLGLDYIDLYLLHWPVAGTILPSWKALEKVYASGRVKAIGVSNHMIHHLEELLAQADVVPAVNQIEFHPYLRSTPLLDFCRAKGIQVEAWSPLMQAGAILKDPVLSKIAQIYGKTVPQVILRWEVQSGVVTIPKSTQKSRIVENGDIFDFALTPAEMAAIDGLDRSERSGADPYHFSF